MLKGNARSHKLISSIPNIYICSCGVAVIYYIHCCVTCVNTIDIFATRACWFYMNNYYYDNIIYTGAIATEVIF